MNGTKVIFRNQVFDWSEKAPFVKSGSSINGALEYDPAQDKVRCHECGGWFRSISLHASREHQIHPKEYKAKHGLRARSSLSSVGSISVRKNMLASRSERFVGKTFSKTGRSGGVVGKSKFEEYRNQKGICEAQLIARISKIAADLGRTPRKKDLDRATKSGFSKIFGTMENFQSSAGLQVLRSPGKCLGSDLSAEVLIELLRDFWAQNKRLPKASDFSSGQLVSVNAYVRRFGSLANAYKEAGLLMVANRQEYLS